MLKKGTSYSGSETQVEIEALKKEFVLINQKLKEISEHVDTFSADDYCAGQESGAGVS